MGILEVVVVVMCMFVMFALGLASTVMIVRLTGRRGKPGEISVGDPRTPEEVAEDERIAFREAQKAFEDLMSYSANTAYGIDTSYKEGG